MPPQTAPADDDADRGARPLPEPPRSRAEWLGLNTSTSALLAAILFVTAGTELWSPLMPEYIKALRETVLGDRGGTRPVDSGRVAESTIWLIALYGCTRDLLEAVNYYAGGAIGGMLGTRRSLLLFNALPLAGLGLLLAWPSTAAVFIALPLVTIWDSIAGPSIITVVGERVPTDRRTMVFSIQSIVRRLARLIAYAASAMCVFGLGRETGFRAAVAVGILFLLLAMVMQLRFLRTTTRDRQAAIHRPLRMLAEFDPQLKRLLIADVLARWAEGMPRELIILYCVPLLSAARDTGAGMFASILLPVQAVTSALTYVVIGPLASRAGTAKKPYIGMTFAAFALFPLVLAALGPAWGLAGLVAAFVVGGLRELGEPARKAMISELIDPAFRTQALGLYWSVRSAAVMLAPLIGGAAWIVGDRLRAGAGAITMLTLAGALGLAGAGYFYLRFDRGSDRAAKEPRRDTAA